MTQVDPNNEPLEESQMSMVDYLSEVLDFEPEITEELLSCDELLQEANYIIEEKEKKVTNLRHLLKNAQSKPSIYSHAQIKNMSIEYMRKKIECEKFMNIMTGYYSSYNYVTNVLLDDLNEYTKEINRRGEFNPSLIENKNMRTDCELMYADKVNNILRLCREIQQMKCYF